MRLSLRAATPTTPASEMVIVKKNNGSRHVRTMRPSGRKRAFSGQPLLLPPLTNIEIAFIFAAFTGTCAHGDFAAATALRTRATFALCDFATDRVS